MKFKFEMNGYGQFRIVESKSGCASGWVSYQSIVKLRIGKRTFIGVSEYYAGCLPTETVMEIKEMETSHPGPLEDLNQAFGVK